MLNTKVLYGSGPGKQASILGCSIKEAERLIKNFFDGNPGLRDLMEYLSKFYKKHGYIKSLDGRRFPARSKHVLLNILIQSSAAILFKKWSCYTWELIDNLRLDAETIILYHDEQDARVHRDCIADYSEAVYDSLLATKMYYNLNVDLATSVVIGMNWREVH